jgi:NADH-quinone oxidoreductase subunit C
VDAVAIIAALKAALPGVDCEPGAATDQPTVIVPRERLADTARTLRDDASLRFDVLVDVTAVDWWPREPRFEVIYHLLSTRAPARLRLKVRLSGDDSHVATVRTVWASADWLEREVWDLFGIVFDQHGDLRRLLMPEDWEGHPLRKDYPVQIKMKPKVYEPLQLTEQEFQANIVADRNVRGGSGPDRSTG